jgi:hypothetical protein
MLKNGVLNTAELPKTMMNLTKLRILSSKTFDNSIEYYCQVKEDIRVKLCTNIADVTVCLQGN